MQSLWVKLAYMLAEPDIIPVILLEIYDWFLRLTERKSTRRKFSSAILIHFPVRSGDGPGF